MANVAEIDLRKLMRDYDDLQADHSALKAKLAEKDTELDQLRAENAKSRLWRIELCAERDELRAENERLKQFEAPTLEVIERAIKTEKERDELKAEVERLKTEWLNKPLEDREFDLTAENTKLKLLAESYRAKCLRACKAFSDIIVYLQGSNHTSFPINVREQDGSISQVRPESNEGKAYNIAKKAREALSLATDHDVDKFLQENSDLMDDLAKQEAAEKK